MQPEGVVRTGLKRNPLCRVLRSLYGLKQAARVWNQKIHGFLIKVGFVRSDVDPCLYIDTKRNIYITIWVDDLLIAQEPTRYCGCKGAIGWEFEMKNLGELKHFLGMRITRNPDGGISIDQSGYIRQVLER